MYTYELYHVENGYGYKIIYENNTYILQEYDPTREGFVVMTKEQAENNAQIIIKRIVGD